MNILFVLASQHGLLLGGAHFLLFDLYFDKQKVELKGGRVAILTSSYLAFGH